MPGYGSLVRPKPRACWPQRHNAAVNGAAAGAGFVLACFVIFVSHKANYRSGPLGLPASLVFLVVAHLIGLTFKTTYCYLKC